MFAGRTDTWKVFYTSSLWTFVTFCFFWASVQGRYHLIGSEEPITAAPGDDVILPCQVDPGWDARRKTVEWSKPDLKVDSSDRQRGVEYVFVYRFQSPDRDIMMASYVQRTSLSSEGLKHGDVSLKLRNVTLEDNGRFRCFIPNLKLHAEVLLLVDPNFVSTTPSETLDNRNLITPEPQDETNGTASSRNRCSSMVTSIFFIIIIIIICCLGANTVHNKIQKSPDLDPESGTSPTVQLLDPESGTSPSKTKDSSAGSDHQNPLSSSAVELHIILDQVRLHG